MKKHKNTVIAGVFGCIYGLAAIFAAGLLLRNLGTIAAWFVPEFSTVVEQLRQAQMVSPWWIALLPAAAAAGLSLLGKRGRVAAVILGIVLLLPMILAAVCMTCVNGISVGALLGQLIPLLPELL